MSDPEICSMKESFLGLLKLHTWKQLEDSNGRIRGGLGGIWDSHHHSLVDILDPRSGETMGEAVMRDP